MPTVIVSDVAVDTDAPCGQAGWADLSSIYQSSFAACGLAVRHVRRPEIYHAEHAGGLLGIAPGDWHLGVRPIHQLRPLHGLVNLFVCDWAFPELSSSGVGSSPFFDQVRQLRLAAAVLCPSPFTTATLRRAGVARAQTFPPAVAVAGSDGGRWTTSCGFVCVADGGDLPRELGPAVEGFALAWAARPHMRLVVRVRNGGEGAVAGLRRHAAGLGCGDAVAVVGYEDTVDLSGIRFFLSSHAAPGLRLPMVQAMMAGLPPVATTEPGGDAWPPRGAAIPIGTRCEIGDGQGEAIGRFMPLSSDRPTAETVRDAVLAAASLDQAAWRRLGEGAREAATERFGTAGFAERLDRLRDQLAQTADR